MEEEGINFTLELPFVVCASQGGPYDDESFVAGWQCARIDYWLAEHSGTWEEAVRRSVLPLVDLIAMRHGCLLRVEEIEGMDEYVWCHFEMDYTEGVADDG